MKFFQSLKCLLECTLKDFFQKYSEISYGEPYDSRAGNFVTSGSAWEQLISIGRTSNLYIRNTDGAKEIYITFLSTENEGYKIQAGGVLYLEKITGVIFTKPVISSDSIAITYLLMVQK